MAFDSLVRYDEIPHPNPLPRARSEGDSSIRGQHACNACDRVSLHVILSKVGGTRRISAMTSATRLPNANRPETLTMSSRKQHLSLKAAIIYPSRRHPAAKDLKTPGSILATRGRDDQPLSKRRSVGLSGRSFRPGSPGMGHCRGLQDDMVRCGIAHTCDSELRLGNCPPMNPCAGEGEQKAPPIRIKLTEREGRPVAF